MLPRAAAKICAALLMVAFAACGAPLSAHAQLQVDVVALDPTLLSSAAAAAPEPFGLKTVPVTHGGLIAKWNGVAADIRTESEVLAHCREQSAPCPAAAQKFLAVIAEGRAHDGRARIGIVNRAVNLSIRPTSDLAQWGVPDHWSPPLETLSSGRGDCEDYAIAKFVALREAGIDAGDLRLVIVRDLSAGEDHAVTAVRLDGSWLVLDNRWLALVADADLRRLEPLFVLANDGVRQFMPVIAQVGRPTSAPGALQF